MGTFSHEGDMPTQAQMDSLYWLVDHLMYEIPTINYVYAHNHFSNQICPGPELTGIIEDRWEQSDEVTNR